MVERRGCRKGTFGLHTNKKVIRNYKCNKTDGYFDTYDDEDDWYQLNQEMINQDKQEYTNNQLTKQTQQEYEMQRLKRSLKKISQKLQMFPNVHFQNNQPNIDDIVSIQDKKIKNYIQTLKNQIEIKMQKKKLIRIHNQQDWKEFDNTVQEKEKFWNNTDQNLYQNEAESKDQKNKLKKSMLIQYLNKFLSQLKINNEISFQNSFIKGSNRNIKYLKGLVYRNINKTEKKQLIYNNSHIVSQRHKFKSDEEKQRKQKLIQQIIKEHTQYQKEKQEYKNILNNIQEYTQYQKDKQKYLDSKLNQLQIIQHFDKVKECLKYFRMPKRPVQRQNGYYKHLFLDNEWTERNWNHVTQQKIAKFEKTKYGWNENYGSRLYISRLFMFNYDKKKVHRIQSNEITGVAPPSFRKGVDGWDFMKNKIGGKIIYKIRENFDRFDKLGYYPHPRVEWEAMVRRDIFIKRRAQLKKDTQDNFKECFDFKLKRKKYNSVQKL